MPSRGWTCRHARYGRATRSPSASGCRRTPASTTCSPAGAPHEPAGHAGCGAVSTSTTRWSTASLPIRRAPATRCGFTGSHIRNAFVRWAAAREGYAWVSRCRWRPRTKPSLRCATNLDRYAARLTRESRCSPGRWRRFEPMPGHRHQQGFALHHALSQALGLARRGGDQRRHHATREAAPGTVVEAARAGRAVVVVRLRRRRPARRPGGARRRHAYRCRGLGLSRVGEHISCRTPMR